MSEKIVLNVTPREVQGNGGARRCRRAGLIPAIIYGKEITPMPVSLNAREFRPYAHKSIHLVDLKDPSGKVTLALVKEVEHNSLKDQVTHIDFQAVGLTEILHAKVPVHYVGTPKGTSEGGLAEDSVHELDIACTATNLPDSITVDVSDVALDGVIHVGDIVLPEGVKCVTDAVLVAFAVHMPAVDPEPVAESAEGDASAKK